jgi:hypothetical protein
LSAPTICALNRNVCPLIASASPFVAPAAWSDSTCSPLIGSPMSASATSASVGSGESSSVYSTSLSRTLTALTVVPASVAWIRTSLGCSGAGPPRTPRPRISVVSDVVLLCSAIASGG